MKTLLVVDDDRLVRRTLRDNLEEQGYLVIEATNAQRMMEIIDHHSVDLVLLDLNLPDGRGIDYIEPLRKNTTAPLIMISGECGCAAKVTCLDNGADDYVTKPFDIKELNARVRAHLRRYTPTSVEAGNAEDIYAFADKILDHRKFQLFEKDGTSCNLSAQEYKLLCYFTDHTDKALHREELCEAIREQNYVPTPRAIDVKITRLRKKIGDDPSDPQILKTIRGIGYMFQNN